MIRKIRGDHVESVRIKLARSPRTSSPRSSRNAQVTNSPVTFLRQLMSKSVLSSGLAMRAARTAASAIESALSGSAHKSFCCFRRNQWL